jgi:hypothetical protein
MKEVEWGSECTFPAFWIPWVPCRLRTVCGPLNVNSGTVTAAAESGRADSITALRPVAMKRQKHLNVPTPWSALFCRRPS